MSGRFLDTNVLVDSADASVPARQARAIGLLKEVLRAREGCVSTQVLSEYFATVTRKLHVAPEIARHKVELVARLHVVVLDTDAVSAAIDLHRLHRISFRDALVLHAATVAGCDEVLSEGLAGGAVIRGLRIVNPSAGPGGPVSPR